MKLTLRSRISILFLILILTACSVEDNPRNKTNSLNQERIVDIGWQALEPNTSSHNQAAWEVLDVRTVSGGEIQELFEGEPIPGKCAPGPTPPDNMALAPNDSYWYVQMRPRPTTPEPQPTEQFSPTAPPIVPEPFVYQAHLLVDASTGQVVARKLYCVIY